jgi:hypothetical protein
VTRRGNTETVRPNRDTKVSKGGGNSNRHGGSRTNEINSEDVEIKIEDDNDDEGHDESKRVPKRMADPKMPTEAEMEERNLTHLPYRSWCVHCVRGRGEQAGHRKQAPRPESAIPEIHMDYCFVGRKSEDAQPIFVARDRDASRSSGRSGATTTRSSSSPTRSPRSEPWLRDWPRSAERPRRSSRTRP